MHGWCAARENRGKGGSRKGKIGARAGSSQFMDLVGIQSGSTLQKACFLNKFGGFPTGAGNSKIGARMRPDWIADWLSSKKDSPRPYFAKFEHLFPKK